MADGRAKRKSKAEWNAVRPVLQRLWLERKCQMKGSRGVKETMEREHGFSATCEPHPKPLSLTWQQRLILRQPKPIRRSVPCLGMAQESKGCDWRAVAQAICAKERRGEGWEVLVHGKAQPQALVRRKISPFIASLISQALDPGISHGFPGSILADETVGCQLPSHVTVKSSCTRRPELLLNLPFSHIEDILYRQNIQCPEATNTSVLSPQSNKSIELLQASADQPTRREGR
jgi:Clr5 domain